MKILSASPCPLSNIRNCSLAQDYWYSMGSSGTSSLLAGFRSCWLTCHWNHIFLLMWCRAGKLMAPASDIPPSSLPNTTWEGSWVSVALLLIFALTFTISYFVSDGAWLWLLIRSRKFPVLSNMIFALHFSLRLFHTPMMLHHSPGCFERHKYKFHESVFCFLFL